jgi:serine carboxypeptidase-like clade 1
MKALICIVALFVALSICDPSANKVTSIPGFTGSWPFAAYAGYIAIPDGEKQMFYFFAESQNDPATDPVVLWLNGGPGCSSFDGFVYEHGPFFFNNGPEGAGQNLTLNPYSWNLVANMIYLDSPCGVGLSYSDNTNDYITNDIITANDSHHFLLNFFKEYSAFAQNDFYIAGESYAGIYVPTLAQQVVLGNSDPNTFINIKGVLVGNGVTDQVFDGNAFVPFIYGHSLIPDDMYSQLVEACDGNYWNATDGPCGNLLDEASDLVSALNIYNIYVDCYLGPVSAKDSKKLHELWYRVSSKVRDTQKQNNGPRGQVPCIDASRATAWLNQDDVRTALHAIPVSQQQWQICTDQIDYSSVYDTVIPIHQFLLKSGLRELIYSGDTDMCVPNTGSEAWTASLNLPLESDWQAWFVNNQVAGYVKVYNQLTYATIKGSGHTVPQYKPAQAFHFFSNFLSDQPF